MRVFEISELLRGTPEGDGEREIHGVAALDAAGPAELSYAEGPRAVERAAGARAGCLLVPEGVSLPGQTTIAVRNPKLALVRAAEALHPASPFSPGIHPMAVVAPDAQLAPDVAVGAHVVIESRVTVGPGTRLGPGVFLGEGVRVGARCLFYPHVTVYPGAQIGDRVVLHAGVVVGSDGFGYVFAEGRHVKFPQLGKIVIEDDVEIGSNSTLDRGSLGTTVIGQGTKIDNLVQIAHNCRIGENVVIAAQTGISGSCVVEDGVIIGGQVGIGDKARIESRAVLGSGCGVLTSKIVHGGQTVWGTPARPLREHLEQLANLARLPDLRREVAELRRRVAALERD